MFVLNQFTYMNLECFCIFFSFLNKLPCLSVCNQPMWYVWIHDKSFSTDIKLSFEILFIRWLIYTLYQLKLYMLALHPLIILHLYKIKWNKIFTNPSLGILYRGQVWSLAFLYTKINFSSNLTVPGRTLTSTKSFKYTLIYI